MSTPEFPIRVIFEDGEVESYENLEDICCNLEWCSTDDGNCSVVDALGRLIRLTVKACDVLIFEIRES